MVSIMSKFERLDGGLVLPVVRGTIEPEILDRIGVFLRSVGSGVKGGFFMNRPELSLRASVTESNVSLSELSDA